MAEKQARLSHKNIHTLLFILKNKCIFRMTVTCPVKPSFQLRPRRHGSMSPRTEQLVEQFPDGPYSNQMPCGTTKACHHAADLLFHSPQPVVNSEQPSLLTWRPPVSGISKVALLASTEQEEWLVERHASKQ